MSARVAVVTGASRGIGRSTAIELARRGLSVALLGRASAALYEAVREVRAIGGDASAVACDVRSAEEVEAAAKYVLAERGSPEIVVNNAGVVRRGTRVEDTEVDAWDEVLSVNLRGAFLVARAFVPAMRSRGSGRLIHVGSISSTIGCPMNASYAASKWGLLGFAKSLAEELRGSGVISVVILPGSVDTAMLEGSGFAPAMGPDEVARAIAMLALDAPPSIHGAAVELFG